MLINILDIFEVHFTHIFNHLAINLGIIKLSNILIKEVLLILPD